MVRLIYRIATTLNLFIADRNGVADESIIQYADNGGDFLESVKQYDAVLTVGEHMSTVFSMA